MSNPSSELLYRVKPQHVKDVVAHTRFESKEHYLIRWTSQYPENAVASWHDLGELSDCLHLVQDYVQWLPPLVPNSGHKRKRPHDETESNGNTTTTSSNRALSISSTSSASYAAFRKQRLPIYNGTLQRKGGFFIAKELSGPNVLSIDATSLPDAAMREAAKSTPYQDALVQIRNKFLRSLSAVAGPRVSFRNAVDAVTPSLHFKWINEYVYGEGVERSDIVFEGCQKCRPDMGGQKGCEYTTRCGCLEYAAPDSTPFGLSKMDDSQKAVLAAWQSGEVIDTNGLPKRFPYTSSGLRAGCLEPFYLNSRYVIYECNSQCRCGPGCKNRNVQHGRKVELEIFRTTNRGFGLRCLQDLRRGQFIDKYLGELITDEEADSREEAARKDAGDVGRASYLFWLDKHVGADDKPGLLRPEDCYIADGEAMGGPTRFINHSCDPNCRMFTVSYNKHDDKIYDLAFFALYDIPANEELTFDYLDAEPDEDEEQAKRNMTQKVQELEADGKFTKVPCYCGAENCRGVMWM